MPLRRVVTRALVVAIAAGLVALAQPAYAGTGGQYEAQIIGGSVAGDNEFPGVVYIEVRQGSGGFACTGALIAPEWVLTAAHCVVPGTDATIYGGDAEPADAPWTETATGQQHPDYEEEGPGDAPLYDIGLYHLEDPHPTSLPDLPVADPGPFTSGTATAVGWGIDESGEVSDVLRRTSLGIRSSSFCRDRAGAAFDSSVMVCMFHDSHFTCSGDSGGPILRNGEIIGVTSWGSVECDSISVAAGNDALAWVHETAGTGGGGDGTDMGDAAERIAGVNRFETAAEIAANFFGTSTVYVTSGRNFPDALAAAPAAAQAGAPVVLVEPTSLPDATAAVLAELQPLEVVVVGGTAAVSDAVVEQLRTASDGATVRRVAGVNRYATAAATMLDAFPSGADHLYIASGRTFPDALVAGARAGYDDGALLLVDGLGALEAEVLAAVQQLAPTRITLVGATTDFGTAVRTALGALATVDAVSGGDAHTRSAALWSDVPAGVDFAFLATSVQFADALAGAAYAALDPSSPLMLIPGTCVPAAVSAELDRLDAGVVVALGGTAAISQAVTDGLATC